MTDVMRDPEHPEFGVSLTPDHVSDLLDRLQVPRYFDPETRELAHPSDAIRRIREIAQTLEHPVGAGNVDEHLMEAYVFRVTQEARVAHHDAEEAWLKLDRFTQNRRTELVELAREMKLPNPEDWAHERLDEELTRMFDVYERQAAAQDQGEVSE